MMKKSRYLLSNIYVILLFCLSILPEVYSQDHPQAGMLKMPECSPWEIEEGCSEGEYIYINGINLYYEVHGQGKPLLLLHGGGGSAEHFNLMLPELRKHFKLITPDTRAQGRSTDTDEPLSYQQMVEDMIALLDSLEIDSAFVGGWSDGAAIAIHMAIYHSERVRALLLTPVDLSSEGLTKKFWEDAPKMDFPKKLTVWWKTRPGPTEEELNQIDAPALFVVGEDEQYVKMDHVAWQYKSIPKAEIVKLPDTDHILVANPDAVNEAFLAFLNRLQY